MRQQPNIHDTLYQVAQNLDQNDSYDSSTLKVLGSHDTTTLRLFGALQNCYNYFRETLFDNTLSPVILTLNKKANSKGYYKPFAWVDEFNTTIPEINISPSTLQMDPVEVMAVLTHEMAHHLHQQIGRPCSTGYHNTEFSEIMFSIGLMCSDTGKSGGRKTGRHMSHYIIPKGSFEKRFNEMPAEYLLPFKPVEDEYSLVHKLQRANKQNGEKSQKNKIKYTCIECGMSVWGKPNLHIVCGQCDMRLAIIENM